MTLCNNGYNGVSSAGVPFLWRKDAFQVYPRIPLEVVSLFSHQIRTFNTHCILTKNLLAQNTNLSFNYEIMFQKYMELISALYQH